MIEDYVHKLSPHSSVKSSPLTLREREVLQLLAEGHKVKEIALRLFVSVPTVETHRRNIKAKLNIHSLAELIKYAISEGLTSLKT
jgi:DNA-binding NarL/FixJ family response regulator